MESATGAVLYRVTLRPNPPMSRAALLSVLFVVAAIDLAFAIWFLLRGAWPITPFMGADVALLAWAFFASRKAARRYEDVSLTTNRLRIERHEPRGPATPVEFNPYWVRVELKEPMETGTGVTLRSHGRAVQIGTFLAPPQKLSVASALRAALQRAREPRFD
ncbi:MAG: DUF2244 domain-containing protein [Rhizomicrobium sp.]